MQSTDPPKFIGIEIGGTKLQLVSGLPGTIEQSIRYFINPEEGAQGIQQQITEGLNKLCSQNNIAGIGVGFGGPVNWQTGTIQLSHQVQGWNDFNIKNWLEQLTGIPAFIDNDANVAALAEAVYGCGKTYDNVFYMTIGSGIGGGLIINKKIYHGQTPGEVEIGHIRLDKNGTTLESKCSGWAVNKKVKNYIHKNPDSLLAQSATSTSAPEAALLLPALVKGDQDAQQIITDIADDIAFALSHVVHLFHPEIIIIGGGLSFLKEHLRSLIFARLPLYVLQAFLPISSLLIAALGENVVPVGALELARQNAAHHQNK